MTQWKVKLTKQWDGLVDPFWNDRLSLWGIHEKGNVNIFRYIDGRKMGSIPLRLKSNEEILTCQLEPNDGDLFAVVLRSGSVKVYKGRQDVDSSDPTDGADMVGTIVLGRGEWFNMEQFVWNRIKWKSRGAFKGDFDTVLTQWLPKLTEMNVSPQGKLTCTPLEFEGPEWNASLSENESNMFLTYDNATRKVMVSIDGTFNFRYGEKNKFPTKVTNILSGNANNYVFLNDEDWQLQIIKLEFTESHQMHELMKCCSQIQFLMKYLRDNHKIIGVKLMEPHATFINSLFPDEQASRLLKGLKDVFYLGYSAEKNIENWFTLKLGRHGISIWKQRNHLFWSSSQGILVTCMIPACERLIVAVKRLQGLIKSLKLNIFGLDDDEELIAPEVDELLQMGLDTLTEIVKQVEKFHIGENMSIDGLTWIEYMIDSLLRGEEDDGNNSNGQDCALSNDVDALDTYPKEHYSTQLFLNNFVLPTQTYKWIKNDFPNKLESLIRQFDLVQKNYTAKWIKKMIKVSGPIRKLRSITGQRLKDAIMDGDVIYMICSKSSSTTSQGTDQDQSREQIQEQDDHQEVDQEQDQLQDQDEEFTIIQYDSTSKELTKQLIPLPETLSSIVSIKFVPGEPGRFLMLTEDGYLRRYLVNYSSSLGIKDPSRITIYNDLKILMEPSTLELLNKNAAENRMIVHSDMAVTILSSFTNEQGVLEPHTSYCQLAVHLM
ncbi:anaphase promoting complex subunit 4 Ecym_4300 [Eremothecium cymbalariae DBVPG|uniref:Anaphase-promoting complex subunit 4 long domain-containing protein n=1 Tax=Eremothecium cymbalariae (strain CBS 270.75 / DBVPG 7215 / KCTC 17166 / NRRL Y-17582) TaxID=931890 RepID=G8JTL0_ERECY|nr:hypothetical protein Ecym_4300 [Eremothecium cymbalariae DBVPG\